VVPLVQIVRLPLFGGEVLKAPGGQLHPVDEPPVVQLVPVEIDLLAADLATVHQARGRGVRWWAVRSIVLDMTGKGIDSATW